MTATEGLLADLRALGLVPSIDEPMSRRGFWRIGGPADVYVEVHGLEQLQAVQALGVPVTVVGNGSNLLVADAGIRGAVVRLCGDLRDAVFAPGPDGPEVHVGGGMMNTVLLGRLRKAERGGAAALAGVPGTLGGAVRMNAGWSMGEIGERVRSVQVVLPGGAVEEISAADLRFGYRRASLPAGAVVSVVRLRLLHDPQEVAAEAEAMRAHLERRRQTQPLDLPSCGSVFKNPPGDTAGRLLDAAGLKGTQRGGARISDLHANFIVNTGEARAIDVWWLVRHARDTVAHRFGVVLEPEVHAVGEWEPGHWPLPPPQAPGA